MTYVGKVGKLVLPRTSCLIKLLHFRLIIVVLIAVCVVGDQWGETTERSGREGVAAAGSD
jgi:hypothetical protein